ncbi:hypothetical protein DFH08DRAFT_794525 [Mycena albidolilacea]|uniref:Uncharacterized protein n=1 Tax=Mycena albidolilacea TaxID=1033008 RepID=A0AAD6Z067_9AGAR|nr:hypothetical protein DFH08DRAFT_794525 [Mycena albidolilacea]
MSEEVKADKAETGRWKPLAIENKPTWELPSPFEVYDNPDWGRYDRGPRPLTRFELTMYELSWALRSKPEWQRKAADLEIRGKWRQEALEQQAGSRVPLTERMIDYVLAELDGYAKIADNERGIERACFQAIWHSDRLIAPDVLERLKTAVKTLEDVPDGQKDWHPGSNNQVLDLVHPSLYYVVYGRTHAYLPGEPRIAANFLPVHAPEPVSEFMSKDFSWLPSDFAVDADGSVKLASSYINNIHPVLHQPLYHVIEEVLTGFIPMFERVLGDSNKENDRLPFSDGDRLEEISCIWGGGGLPCYPEVGPGSDEDELEYNEKFWASIPKILPEAKEYTGQLEARFMPVSLRGRTVQCIIKLANIHLTPEQPEYKCGSWHVEGMVNERIVASGIYYYDEENITESQLSFRVAVSEPEYHAIDDRTCTRTLYNMDRDDELIQRVGAVVTKAGRALAWPNLFQHCVSPFALADPSKPGHRKILAFFLVDPTKDRILSATDVPPQQVDWAAAAFQEACEDDTSAPGSLPQELRELVKDHFPETVMTRKEAEAYRLDLMAERTASVETHERAYVQTFNMCEH